MAIPVSKEEALTLAQEAESKALRYERKASNLAVANEKLNEQLAHVPELPSSVTGGISVAAAAATSFVDGYMTKPDAKEDEEEIAASIGTAALGAGVAIATGSGKIKDIAIATAEGAAAGLAGRTGFREGRRARIKAEAERARGEAAKK
jgi:hypothetical protein